MNIDIDAIKRAIEDGGGTASQVGVSDEDIFQAIREAMKGMENPSVLFLIGESGFKGEIVGGLGSSEFTGFGNILEALVTIFKDSSISKTLTEVQKSVLNQSIDEIGKLALWMNSVNDLPEELLSLLPSENRDQIFCYQEYCDYLKEVENGEE